ncbi:hypothetical protein NGM10_02280 [Halorussus salilacus]|uniref:hypothetical protein n=1 Tax=Halorussus salilacus TaxID=2953750 RepID=UPI0020A09EFC|nr:hypothetical protein [Halorussus salilacus]USZ68579.1 hypothetical protein NGM10_02280 [Halorussus salilacus]
MADRNTANFRMTRNEARVVVAALSDEEMTASPDRGERLQNVQDRLASEFGFDQYRETGTDETAAGDEGGWIDDDAVFGDDDPDDTEEIALSRAEVDVVTDALARFERDESKENAGTAESVRRRIADAF